MTRSFLALGTNISPRKKNLLCARQALLAFGHIAATAPLYECPPYGFIRQKSFYNTALILETNLSPEALLQAVKSVEIKCGRQSRFRWGPREIDIDIILFDNQQTDLPHLKIPHIDFQNRRFVLQPLCDLDAGQISPADGKSLAELLRMCPDPSKLVLVEEQWWKDAPEN